MRGRSGVRTVGAESWQGMKEPNRELLLALAEALEEAEHRNVAGHLLAGVLWAMYPEWFDQVWLKRKI